MLAKLKNPDLAALLTMLVALGVELATQLAGNPSLLAMLPSWLGPVVLAVAAAARFGLAGRRVAGQLGEGEPGSPAGGLELPDRPTLPD